MNRQSLFIPNDFDMRVDPEIASLAILEVALITTRNSFQAHIPQIGDPSRCLSDELPEPRLLLAELIMYRIEELRDILDLYRRFGDVRRAREFDWAHEDEHIF